MKNVFISYVHEDFVIIETIFEALKEYDIPVWLDKNRLEGGTRWQEEISKAIQECGVFIACFSSNYSEKDSSYMDVEIKIALKELEKKPRDKTWFIPLKLNECDIPEKFTINSNENLNDIQHIELINKNFEYNEDFLDLILTIVLPIIKPKKYWDIRFKRILDYHIKEKINFFETSNIQRFKEIEDRWISLSKDTTIKTLSSSFFELQDRAKNTKQHQLDQIVEKDRIILLSFIPFTDVDRFIKSLSVTDDNFTNKYLQFIMENCRKLRGTTNWEKKDLVHIIYFEDEKETLFDIFYIINRELSLMITGYIAMKQIQSQNKTGEKFLITYENMFPTSIINAHECSDFFQNLSKEEVNFKKRYS